MNQPTAASTHPQRPASTPVADDLDRYLEAYRERTEAPGLTEADRARMALDASATLERAGDRAEAGADRRRLLERAATLLEAFNVRYPENLEHPKIALQAAVFRWAIGRDMLDGLESGPDDPETRRMAIDLLDRAAEAIRPIAADGPPGLVEEARYRRARALIDATAEGRDDRLIEALLSLNAPFQRPELRGPAGLLRVEALTRLGRFDEADDQLEKAKGEAMPPTVQEQSAARVELELARGDRIAAQAAIDAIPSELADLRDALSLKLALDQARSDDVEPSVRDRAATEAIDAVARLRDRDALEFPRALARLGRGLDAPPKAAEPSAFALLAEASRRVGRIDAANRLDEAAADRAEALGRGAEAAEHRLRAAASRFRAGEFVEAARLFERVADEPAAGAARPRAALLRAIALDRAGPGRGRSQSIQAFANMIARFPEAPEANEARWLLGRSEAASGDSDAAVTHWEAIPPEHPRRFDAQLAVADLAREAAERLARAGDPEARSAIEWARAAFQRLESGLERDDPRRGDVALGRIELETIPGLGDPSEAVRAADRALAVPIGAELRDRLASRRVLALAASGRFPEADRALEAVIGRIAPADRVPIARRLDALTASAPSDVARRRLGELLRRAADIPEPAQSTLSPAARAELDLRRARADLHRGDPDAARAGLAPWTDGPGALPSPAVPDLADLAKQVDMPALAAESYRIAAKSAATGTRPWLRARLGQAAALVELGETSEAIRLLNAAEALAPAPLDPGIAAELAEIRRRIAEHN